VDGNETCQQAGGKLAEDERAHSTGESRCWGLAYLPRTLGLADAELTVRDEAAGVATAAMKLRGWLHLSAPEAEQQPYACGRAPQRKEIMVFVSHRSKNCT
jgi:hypothetical protein